MKRVIISIFILLLFCTGLAEAGTITCGDRTWTTDGINDHEELQQALDYAAETPGSTIYLSSDTYNVDHDQMTIPSDTEITGDKEAVLKLIEQPYGEPTPSVTRAIFLARGSNVHDISIHGFVIDGNAVHEKLVSGNDHLNMIQLYGATDVEIYDMTLKNGLGDGIKIREASRASKESNIKIYNNHIDKIGHDAVYLINVNGADVYGNWISCRNNAGVRAVDSNNVKIHENEITSENHGGAGIEIQKLSDTQMTVDVYENEIYHTRDAGIWAYGYKEASADSSQINISDNEITDCGLNRGGGVTTCGLNVNLENNKITDNKGHDVAIDYIDINTYTTDTAREKPQGDGYKIILNNNEIGKEIENKLSSSHDVEYGGQVEDRIIPEQDTNNEQYVQDDTNTISISSTGSSSEQDVINKAIKKISENGGGTVCLSGEFAINNPIELKSNVCLDGQGQTTITIPDNVNRITSSDFYHKATKGYATVMVPLIKATNCENIEITGIHFDGNADRQTDLITGRGFYNFIMSTGCAGVNVHDCTGSNSLGDFLRATKCSNVEFKDIEAHKLGHEALFAIKSDYVEMSGCNIDCRINNAARIRDSNHAYIHDNFITCTARESAGPGVQLDKTDKNMEMNVEVCNNVFKMTGGPGMWIAGTQSNYDESNSQIKIHHNAFLSTGWDWRNWQAGILISGVHNVNIFNNVFDGCSNAGIVTYSVNGLSKGANGANFCIDIQDNIITNTKAGHNTGSGKGYGISNTLENSHKIISKDNILWGNSAGNYNRCSGSDYEQDPRVNPGSSEWYWTGSTWECDYVSAEMTMRGGTGVEDIEDEDFEPGPEREFDSIFDVLGTTFYDIAGGSYDIILPENITEIPTESTWTIEQHENSALVYGPTEGMTSIKCEYAGQEGVHTVMIGERTGWTMTYNTVSTWKGDIQRTGDSFYLEGEVDPEALEITCYTPKGTFEPQINVIQVENEVHSFNYYILFYLIIVGILLSVPVCVLYIVFVWR